MPKTPKVVPIAEDKAKIIAQDEKTYRFILGVGKQRVAMDFLTRITNLPPRTGDQPADVLPMKKKRPPKQHPPTPERRSAS